MEPFGLLESVAAPMPDDNVDTDVIYPARFLLLMDRAGLGQYAFNDRRYDSEGRENPDFILNRAPFRNAKILIAGENFGCGSSREQAVWTLAGFGIRCIIAPSFGEIFYANCGKNGILPITLAADQVAMLIIDAHRETRFAIDLPSATMRIGDAGPVSFDIAPKLQAALINGWDETEMILNVDGAAIVAFEGRQRTEQPWLYEEMAG